MLASIITNTGEEVGPLSPEEIVENLRTKTAVSVRLYNENVCEFTILFTGLMPTGSYRRYNTEISRKAMNEMRKLRIKIQTVQKPEYVVESLESLLAAEKEK